jgi:hypothetical protein
MQSAAGSRPESLIEAHEEAALAATIATGLLAVVAGAALWRLRRGALLGRGWSAAALILAMVTAVALAWVATLGGRISHPEIRPITAVGTPAPLDD